MSSKLPRCECCGRSFHSDLGHISRQKFCKYADCVLERKRLRQRKWYARKRAEDAAFREHENARCREAHRRRRAAARSPDLPGPATLLLTSSVLPEVITGLLSKLVDMSDPVDLADSIRAYAARAHRLAQAMSDRRKPP